MKFKICHKSGDSFILENDNLEELRKQVDVQTNKRNWSRSDCWSEKLSDANFEEVKA